MKPVSKIIPVDFKTTEILGEILSHRVTIKTAKPVQGFWDGGKKDTFEFIPTIERTPGPTAIRWGSYAANLWVVVEVGKGFKQHLNKLRRTLRTNVPSRMHVRKALP